MKISISGSFFSSFLINHLCSWPEPVLTDFCPQVTQMLSECPLVLCEPGHSVLSVCVDMCVPQADIGREPGLVPKLFGTVLAASGSFHSATVCPGAGIAAGAPSMSLPPLRWKSHFPLPVPVSSKVPNSLLFPNFQTHLWTPATRLCTSVSLHVQLRGQHCILCSWSNLAWLAMVTMSDVDPPVLCHRT